ncbi:bifunctional metallophosphatase/5'-nucleotidase, partial [Intestinimonas sp. HCP28S3_D6]|uniref:bifunctional metallophosphatase/5'-nucleotidase n=1 Tax=Intestinimonas sp. HCP28S3_D6 TaxID=3438942 RepID=UPI003F89FD57
MKKKVLSLALAAAMTVSLAAPALAAEESESGKIVILHTNDVHCGIDPVTDEETGAVTNMGYAGVAAYKAEMEAQYGAENVTLVDAGDAIQGGPIGTLSKGSYIVDIMNEVGYDFAIPGNHEFDYGMDNFLTLAQEKAAYTYLCCNFTDLKGKSVLDAYKVVDYGDVSVGYVGIDTPESFTKSTPTYFQDAEGNYIYSFSQGNDGADLYAAVQKAVDAAVADGADYVVALGHLGNEGSTDVWTSKAVIANTTGIDVFIDGHSHETYEETVQNKDGEDVTLAQTGTKLANIGKVVIDTKTGDITAELVSGYDKQDETVAAYVAKVNEEFAGVLQEVVAKSDVALTTLDPATGERAVRNAETNLGDLCADAYRVLLGADVAFVNGGGIRADIPAGDITYEQIINVHPFGNEACLVETTGQDILDALEMGARLYPEENGGFLQVSGISYTIDASVPSSVVLNDEGEFVKVDGDYRVKDVMVGDEPLDVTKTYTLASHNYMLKSGGDGFVMFKGDTLLKDSVLIDNQVLINYIVDELGGVVSETYAEPQGRITIVNADQAAETPAEEPKAPADWADVAADAWYAEAVNYVIEGGIMGSTSTDAQVFTPNGTVTRATV